MIVVYSPDYAADLGGHVWPIQKYRQLYELLVGQEGWPEDRVLAPEDLSRQDLARVHLPEYLDDLEHLRATPRTLGSELPLTASVRDFQILMCGGTLRACRAALEQGCALHLGGGFHHAFPDHGEGFCLFNDTALALACLRAEGRLDRALVVDLDVHQGNGTAFIFRQDPQTSLYDMHQDRLYPKKEKGGLQIPLATGLGDWGYQTLLEATLPGVLDRQGTALVVYLAGADPYRGDRLGGLRLSVEGLRQRDRFVLENCRRRGLPVAILLAGGYAADPGEVVQIHLNTFRVARELFA